ncbi:DUF6717 family protein [Pedobacter sp. BG31]|uniref:DUF6717 family protein n=1 Tax=Pedobacter sp. BG31 TaxID=3349697 RepID=UPI0035F3CA55
MRVKRIWAVVGDYLLEQFRGEFKNHKIWLCRVTEFVFKHLPERIYFKELK